ncbi:MAG: GPP34 family phosphoprotein, partial [Actinomycetota bacterium]
MVVGSTAPTGDPTLDDALAKLAGKDMTPHEAIQLLRKGMPDALFRQLAEAGVLKPEVRRV